MPDISSYVSLHGIQRWLLNFASQSWETIDWVIQKMDMTQWGIVALIMAVLGAIALRSTR